jgi:hypothetical protein
MGIYATVAELRAEPEVPDAAPPADATLEALLTQAEDQIDEWLGGWPLQTTGPSAGRKIAQTGVQAWQWAKLKRATLRLAARLYATPDILAGAQWQSISGPDFSKSGPAPATRRISDVAAPLNASGLRVLGARA